LAILKKGSLGTVNKQNFFETLVGIRLSGNVDFKVLREYDGTADAEILSGESIILLETKIISGTLREKQINRHLLALKKYPQKNFIFIDFRSLSGYSNQSCYR